VIAVNKKKIAVFLMAGSMLVLTACGMGDNHSGDNLEAPKGDYRNGVLDGKAGSVSDDKYENSSSAMFMSEKEAYDKKIVKNANLTLRSQDVNKSYNDYLAYIKEQGGYEFNMSMSANTGYTTIDAIIKIPPQNIDSAVQYAYECGDVTSLYTKSDDITEKYHDTKLRLEYKRKNLEIYYDLPCALSSR
jgi:hypothetical protein